MKLSAFKTEQKLTDDALAALIGDCSVSALRKWFSGERIPRKDQMERIAEVTGGKVLPNDFYDISPPAESEAAA